MRRLTKKGIFTRDALGYDLATSIANYVAYREGIAAEKAGSGEYGKVRIEVLKERAMRMKMDREALAGTLVPTASVIAFGTQIIRAVTTRLLGVATKLAPRLATMKIAEQIEAYVRAAIEEALEGLSQLELVPTKPSASPPSSRAKAS